MPSLRQSYDWMQVTDVRQDERLFHESELRGTNFSKHDLYCKLTGTSNMKKFSFYSREHYTETENTDISENKEKSAFNTVKRYCLVETYTLARCAVGLDRLAAAQLSVVHHLSSAARVTL